MDCLFNKIIPLPESSNEIIFKPSSKTFINGLAASYDFIYDSSILCQYMKESQFVHLTDSLNEELLRSWPCTICLALGYLCSPCSLGLSFLCPYSCISSAKEAFSIKLNDFNKNYFEPKGLYLSYHQKCSTSWVKLSVLNDKKLPYSGSNSTNINTNSYVQYNKEKECLFNSKRELFLNSVDSRINFDVKN